MPGPANFLKKQETSFRTKQLATDPMKLLFAEINLGEFALDEDPALAQLQVLTAPKVLCHNSAPQFLSMYQEFLNLRQK